MVEKRGMSKKNHNLIFDTKEKLNKFDKSNITSKEVKFYTLNS